MGVGLGVGIKEESYRLSKPITTRVSLKGADPFYGWLVLDFYSNSLTISK